MLKSVPGCRPWTALTSAVVSARLVGGADRRHGDAAGDHAGDRRLEGRRGLAALAGGDDHLARERRVPEEQHGPGDSDVNTSLSGRVFGGGVGGGPDGGGIATRTAPSVRIASRITS